MAEGVVEVTAGSGTKLHSWSKTVGANTVHDEFTLPGEFPYASYSVVHSAVSVATTGDHVLQLMAGSSLNVRIRRIRIEQVNSATTASLLLFSVLRLTTAGSGGNGVTPSKFDNSDSAAGATSQNLPSSKGTESVKLLETVLTLRQTVATSGAQIDDYWEWQQHPGTKPIIIPSGTSNGIAIKIGTGVAGATVTIVCEFVETNF